MSKLHVRMLQRAAQQLGGIEEVARYLQVPEARLRLWLRGALPMPCDIFLRLVDLLSEVPPAGRPSPPHPRRAIK